MKILHLANWNSTNIGNGALIKGTERVLSEDIPGVEFVPEAWDDYTFGLKKFDEQFVALVNKHDALMVNGAVTFNAFRRFNTNTGMRFDLPLHLWDKIKKPIILYGLSYRCWPFQAYPNRDAFKKFLAYALAHPDRIFFGVRNDGTKEWIKRTFGVDSPEIHEIPDPGMFVPYEDRDYPELHPSRKNIIVAFNGEDPVYRFATDTQRMFWKWGLLFASQPTLEKWCEKTGGYKRVRSRVIRELAHAMEKILEENPDVQFILAPHYLDDYGMVQEFVEGVSERVAHQRTVSTGLLGVPYTAYFYGRYKKADLVIGMRVHSMSPTIGLGVPIIPVTSQGRMRNFLAKIGLADIAIDVSKSGFGERIAERARTLLRDPSEQQNRLKTASARMREEAREKNMLVRKRFRF